MSPAFQRIAAALAADEVLRERVMSATTLTERAAILAEAGLSVPSAEELADRAAGLDTAQGGADAWLVGIAPAMPIADSIFGESPR